MDERTEARSVPVSQRVEAIVGAGRDVRRDVGALVVETAGRFQAGGEGLVGLCRSVMKGVADAFRKSVPEDPESTLRQVVDGLGDGLSTAAHATQLAVSEAKTKGEQFAQTDVEKAAADLQALSNAFVGTVEQAATGLKTHLASQSSDLASHAKNTLRHMKPSIAAALAAARQHPVALGKEALGAGAKATRQTAGLLFAAIGELLQDAGQRLKGGDESPR